MKAASTEESYERAGQIRDQSSPSRRRSRQQTVVTTELADQDVSALPHTIREMVASSAPVAVKARRPGRRARWVTTVLLRERLLDGEIWSRICRRARSSPRRRSFHACAGAAGARLLAAEKQGNVLDLLAVTAGSMGRTHGAGQRLIW